MKSIQFTEDEYRHLLSLVEGVLDPATYLGGIYAEATWWGKRGEASGLKRALDRMKQAGEAI